MTTTDLILPDRRGDEAAFRQAVRQLRDHLLGAVDIDMAIMLNGQPFTITWGDRRHAATDEAAFSIASGMRVMEGTETNPAEIVSSGEEQITIVIDGERLVFHLVEVKDREPDEVAAPPRALR
ncbi:hypothetical protein [Bauldia litoralis]|uniref:Uncharacterized protein n=1 Tax=Bauldia litoralis TaxID=665467 RepID=A0A1G6B5B5_9HYPH|nr:hypothetical protein [Bauldia litoralis]SDB15850.1 hypothetical protein SAMN02982931_01251 [Bauldia litoralis]